MRNLHNILEKEFGRESVAIFRDWEHHVKKLANFKNHRRFNLEMYKSEDHPSKLEIEKKYSNKKRQRNYREGREAIIRRKGETDQQHYRCM